MKFSRLLCAAVALSAILPFRLAAQTPAAEETAGLQWTVFEISPENAILTVDGSRTLVTRNGVLQLMLAPGVHTFTCESPFYDPGSGDFELKEDKRENVRINLVPAFGYVTVISPVRKAEILFDGDNLGSGKATSGRVMQGMHTLWLVQGGTCLYRGKVAVGKGERVTVEVGMTDLDPVPIAQAVAEAGLASGSLAGDDDPEALTGSGWGGINVHSNFAGAQVIVNGLQSGTSPCIIRTLRAGQTYRITLKMEGCKDVTKMVRVKGGEVTDLEIKLKKRR